MARVRRLITLPPELDAWIVERAPEHVQMNGQLTESVSAYVVDLIAREQDRLARAAARHVEAAPVRRIVARRKK